MKVLDKASYEATSIWPIKVRIVDKLGYTLWTNASENDSLLSLGDNMILFKTTDLMSHFILHGGECTLSAFAGYTKLRSLIIEHAINNEKAEYHNVPYYDLNRIAALFREADWPTWNIQTLSHMLNCLNFVWDAAITLGETSISNQLKGETKSHLGDLMDTLTFIDKQTQGELAAFDFTAISDLYNKAVARIRQRVLFIS